MSRWNLTVVCGGGRAAALVIMLMTCVSCTTLEPLSRPDVDGWDAVGHDIRVTTKDGRVMEFRLEMVTETALIGASEEVRFDQIALVERRDLNFWGTAGLVAGVAVGAAGALLLLFVLGVTAGM